MDTALLDAIRAGDRKALSRAISQVEHDGAGFRLPLPEGVVGITGPPGAGKSTLISQLIGLLRERGETVAVLAVDPSSPVTGGALLGDRIRMQTHVDDEGVYIRSMAARGHLGGLSAAAGDAMALLGAAGFDHLIVETVGVGQSEVEVMEIAQVVVLVVGPDWGDQIQADKAGVVEIADVIVVNKADRPGVDGVQGALSEVADVRGVNILTTTAIDGGGVEDLLSEVDRLLG